MTPLSSRYHTNSSHLLSSWTCLCQALCCAPTPSAISFNPLSHLVRLEFTSQWNRRGDSFRGASDLPEVMGLKMIGIHSHFPLAPVFFTTTSQHIYETHLSYSPVTSGAQCWVLIPLNPLNLTDLKQVWVRFNMFLKASSSKYSIFLQHTDRKLEFGF